MAVRFGLRVPAFPVDGSSGTEFVLQIFRYLRELERNFDSAWVCDHFVPWATFEKRTTSNMEGFTTISYLSGVFANLTFGNIVLCNSYRNPALLAKMGATLQAFTGGRFVLGIEAGWMEEEYSAYGYEFPSSAVRIRQLEEGVKIVRRMWIKGRVTFKGRYYQINDAYCYPKPSPRPPIMIGGGGEKLTLRVVARYADWWNLSNTTPQTYEHKLKVLQEHCNREGRDASQIVKTLGHIVAIAGKEKEAREIARKSPFVREGDEESYIIGSPDEVIAKIKTYIRIGVKHFILRFLDFPRVDGMKLFSQKVIPHFSTASELYQS